MDYIPENDWKVGDEAKLKKTSPFYENQKDLRYKIDDIGYEDNDADPHIIFHICSSGISYEFPSADYPIWLFEEYCERA